MPLRLPEPNASGVASSDGIGIAWQSFGEGEETVVFVPTWNFVDSRVSARQVPDLSRRFRVVTYDARGSGASDHPETGYRFDDHAGDALAVMDAAGIDRALVVAASAGVNAAVIAATRNPERVDGLVLVAPAVRMDPEADSDRAKRLADFHAARETYDGPSRRRLGWRPSARHPIAGTDRSVLMTFLGGDRPESRPEVQIR